MRSMLHNHLGVHGACGPEGGPGAGRAGELLSHVDKFWIQAVTVGMEEGERFPCW